MLRGLRPTCQMAACIQAEKPRGKIHHQGSLSPQYKVSGANRHLMMIARFCAMSLS